MGCLTHNDFAATSAFTMILTSTSNLGIHRVPKKWYAKLISITWSNLNGFLKFFHYHTLRKICYKMSLKNPTTP